MLRPGVSRESGWHKTESKQRRNGSVIAQITDPFFMERTKDIGYPQHPAIAPEDRRSTK